MWNSLHKLYYKNLTFCEAFHSLINYITITISFPHNTVSIRYSLSRYKINLRELPKKQSRMDNPEIQVTLGTQNTGRRQTKYKYNIEN